MIKNGLQYELTEHNLDMKFHGLSSDIIKIGKPWLNTDSTNPLTRSKLTLKLFEFKIFGFAVFLNKLRVDNNDIFKKFTRVCLSQLLQELDGLELRAHESMYFSLPGHFHRDQQYLVEKLQDFMLDIENYRKNGTYPKFSQVSILEMPLDHAQEVHYKIQSSRIIPEFLESFTECLEKLEYRYNHTPGVKTQEEIDQQKQKFASMPSGSKTLDPKGIDGISLGSTTQEIISFLGNPDKDSRWDKYSKIDQHLIYYNSGIELGFKENELLMIGVFSGRPEPHGETKYQKYSFRNNADFNMEDNYDTILKLFGPPDDEKEGLKAPIPFIGLKYGNYDFTFNKNTGQLTRIYLKSPKLGY
jgi:hypothetical protein